ncbi:MAG: DNA polymerase III subunit delta [Rikenellaceae bacterium]
MAKSVKIGFKESYNHYNHIMSQLKKKEFKGIYLLMGEEPFFIDAIADYIVANTLTPELKEFNQTVLYGNATSASEVVNLSRQYPMMGDKSLVVLREAQNLSDIASLVHYVKSPLSSTILVICHKDKLLDKRSALYKSFNEDNSVVFESISPREWEVDAWITDLAKSKGKTIDNASVQMMVQCLGADLTKINNELEKLFTALPASKEAITPIDIENYIGISKDYNNFELTKALSEHDVYKALLIAKYFAQSQKQNPYVVTISMLHTHFYRIFNLAIMVWTSQKRNMPLPSEMELAKILALPTPFFLKEYMQAIKYYNSAKAFAALSLIREYDLKGKGLNQGSASVGELLEELILKIIKL